MSDFLRHLEAIIVLPGMMTVVIPASIVILTGDVNVGWRLASPLNVIVVGLGLALILLGLVVLYSTISLFAIVGEGTLAPWMPTQKLVVHGLYRYMRHPMISGVFVLLLGEAVLLGSVSLFYWFLAFTLINLLYIQFIEEPVTAGRFGDAYLLYEKNVPAWLPRLQPWNPPQDNTGGGSSEQKVGLG